MRRVILAALLAGSAAAPVHAREAVDAAAPVKVAITVYRDPERGIDDTLDRDDPRGFAMISETREVTLPPGESTIRFAGVAEGMVAVTAIVTGLPGGTIEKNRNADLLSPAALVDGTLGNRVTVTRTNPATGAETTSRAVVRTRADGGLVLETDQGFEAVRCAGLPERLGFDRVPAGLSASPVYSVDTVSPAGGRYTVTLTYLAWGFDWQAHYVASFLENAYAGGEAKLALTSWLTLVNDNGQSFPDAELMAVAGKLKVESDYEDLADPPTGRRLRLQCYPLGSTAAGTPVYPNAPPPPPPPPPPMMAMPVSALDAESIVVTGSRMSRAAMVAQQEELGDLKLYRVPQPVTVAAKSAKQVAFLQREGVTGELLYTAGCDPWSIADEASPARILLRTVNDRAHQLGVPLPSGRMTVFAPAGRDELLVAEQPLRDFASGEEVELAMGESAQVFATCTSPDPDPAPGKWQSLRLTLTNANPAPARVRVNFGPAAGQELAGAGSTRIKNGALVREITIPANRRTTVAWRARTTDS